MAQGEGGGRPTKYRSSFVPMAKMLSRKGATDFEIAQALGINRATFYLWMQTHQKFHDAVKLGKSPADKRTERSLFERANGYSYEAEEIFLIDEVVERPAPTKKDPKAVAITRTKKALRVPVIKHVPPSDTSLIFWLKNRRKDRWRDYKAVELSTPPGRPLAMTYVPKEQELLQDYYAKLAQSAAATDPDPPAPRDLGPERPDGDEPGDGEGFSPR
jgi:transposase-like protein